MSDFSMHLDPQSYAKVQRQLMKLGDIEKQEVVAKGLKDGAQVIAERTKENINQRLKQRTGNLYNSVKVLQKKKDGKVYVGFKRPGGNHAHLLEFGTVRNVKARKFQRDAVQQKGDEAMKIVQDSISNSIDKIMNK